MIKTKVVVVVVAMAVGAGCSSNDESADAPAGTTAAVSESVSAMSVTGETQSTTTPEPTATTVSPESVQDRYSCSDVDTENLDPVNLLSQTEFWVSVDPTNVAEFQATIAETDDGATIVAPDASGDDATIALTATEVDAIAMVGDAQVSTAWIPVIDNTATTAIVAVDNEWVFASDCATETFAKPLQATFGESYNVAVRTMIATSGDILTESVEQYRVDGASTVTSAP